MKLDFDVGLAIVAGGSGALGGAVAQLLAQAGVPVAITFRRRESEARKTKTDIEAAGGACSIYQVDLANAGEVEGLFTTALARHGNIAHVIYAAGPSFSLNYVGSIPTEEWARVVNDDINGAFNLIQCAVRSFRQQQTGGNVVALTTSAVDKVPVKDIMSAAPKAAIEMLVKGVAKESGRFGIRANCVAPGWIDAGLGKTVLRETLPPDARKQIADRDIPLRRFGSAADVANAVAFLCSLQAAFVTGQTLAVDGGLQL